MRNLVFSFINLIDSVIPIFVIPDDRMPDGGQMGADLMGTSGDQPDFQPGPFFRMKQGPVPVSDTHLSAATSRRKEPSAEVML